MIDRRAFAFAAPLAGLAFAMPAIGASRGP